MPYKKGDKSKGVCYNCETIVDTTFRKGSLKYEGIIIPNILQGYCDKCGNSISIPHQSSEDIRNYLDKHTAVSDSSYKRGIIIL